MPVLKPGTGGGGGGPGPRFGPRKDWQFILGPDTGGWEQPIPHPSAVTVTWRLTDAHDASFTVNAAAGYDTGITPLATDLHILFGGKPVFRGRCGNTSDALSAGAHTLTTTATSYRGLLERRALYSTSHMTWANADIGTIVLGLLAQTQDRAGGDLGIVKGTGFPFGATASKTCAAGDMVAEKIDDLAYVDPGGFDWDITPSGQSQQTIDLWPNARGQDRGVILQYGDALTGTTWTRDLDTSAYADALRMTGTDPAPPVEVEATTIGSTAEGRWDAVTSCDEADPATLRARAVLALQSAGTLTPSYTIPLVPGAWDGPGHIWIGDTIHVSLASGRFRGVLETLRVLEIAATIGPDATQVTLTAGQPRPDLRRELKRLVRELRKSRKTRVAGRNPRTGYTVNTAPSGT
jgi:hypothetical protein